MSKFYTSGVAFDQIETVLRIYRRKGLTKAEVLNYFTSEEYRALIETQYDSLEPMTAVEALKFENAEQRMVAMRVVPPEDLVKEVKAELIDRQVVKKKQIRWDENLKPYQNELNDEYELYKIPTEALGLTQNRWVKPAIYAVKCNCTTTGRVFYLYVDENAARAGDAISAIAWTYRYNGVPLTKDQYLNLLYSET